MYDEAHLCNGEFDRPAAFDRPMDVVEAKEIQDCEKLYILKAWEVDERALQRAEDEGMGGGEHAHLQQVQAALGRLRGMSRGL